MADDWPAHAACKGLHSTDEESDVMFPRSELAGPDVRRAKRVCAGCPVRVECLADALARGEGSGVWGGLTTPERAEHRQGAPVLRCPRCGLWFAGLGRVACRACTGPVKRQPDPASAVTPKPEPPAPSDPRCGTAAGVSFHLRQGTPMCGPCRAVRNARDRAAVAARNAARAATGYANGIERRKALAAELAAAPVSARQAAQRMGCTPRTARHYLKAAREALAAAS